MVDERLDKIYIRDLLLRCIIGLYGWERGSKQDVIINIVLYVDLKKAGQMNNVGDTVDYKAIEKNVVQMVELSSFSFIEGLAESVAQVCLEDPDVKKVNVLVDKTDELRLARRIAIEITREQNQQ